jgi:hypothetical protein
MPASNAVTRELLAWQPTHPGLLQDLDGAPLLKVTFDRMIVRAG